MRDEEEMPAPLEAALRRLLEVVDEAGADGRAAMVAGFMEAKQAVMADGNLRAASVWGALQQLVERVSEMRGGTDD